jgi:hypothetical protein
MRAAFLLLALLAAGAAFASGIEAGVQHVILMPAENGALEIESSRGFSAHAEVFWSDALSTRAAVTFLNPAAILYPRNPPPDDIDLGTLGLDIYSVSARFHVRPRSRLSAFAGAGGAFVEIGNLDDQFGNDVEIDFDPELSFIAEGGLRYRFRSRIILEAGVTYLPLEADSKIERASDPRYGVPETVKVNPLIVSVGAAWRF